jgi:hypothetical protein
VLEASSQGLGKSRGTACTYREITIWYLPATINLDDRIKQKGSSPLRLLLPQVRISRLLFCCEGDPASPNQGVRCVAVHALVLRLDLSESCTVITCCSSSCASRRPTASMHRPARHEIDV